jgi:TonB family protein
VRRLLPAFPPLLALLALLALPFAALAQGAGAPSEQREWEVQGADGGFTLRGFGTAAPPGAPDGGTGPGQLVPPALEQDAPAPYPEALREERVAGEVGLQLLVGEDGAVREVVLVQGAHPLLDAAAQAAARGLRFRPGLLDGAPVAVRVPFTYRFLAPAVEAATGTLALEVRAKGTRAPVAGAALLAEDGRVLGETDAAGKVTLALPPGRHVLSVRAQGHHPATFTEEGLTAGETRTLVYRVAPLQVDPYQTVVRGERPRTEVARTTLRAQELREAPGTLGDPFRVVMLMPGVSSVASGISYPVVRGALPGSTGYFVDGVRVPVLYHLMLGPAVVHPEFVDRLDFTPGLPSLRHGRLMAGAVEAGLARPSAERLRAYANADFINAGGLVEGVVPGAGTEVTLAGRTSYSGWLLGLGARLFTPPDPDGYRIQPRADFYDYQARVEQPLGPGRLRLLALGSSDVVGVGSDNPKFTDYGMVTRFHRVDLRWRQPLLGGEGEVGVTAGGQAVGLDAEGPNVERDYLLGEEGASARVAWVRRFGEALELSLGADVERRRTSTELGGRSQREDGTWAEVQGSLLPPAAYGTQTGAWAQGVWEPAAGWSLAGGARVDGWRLSPGVQHLSVDPRLSVRRALSDTLTLKLGTGLVHQAPVVLLPVPVLDLSGLRYGLQEAWQVDAGAEWQPLAGWDVRVDGYFSRLTRAVEFDLERLLRNQRVGTLLASGAATTGHAYGLELMLRRHLGGNWFGWLSYSLQRSTRRRTFLRFDETLTPVGGPVTADLPFAYDQTHVANLTLSHKLPNDWTVGANLHFNTGRPESGQLSTYTHREGVDARTGGPRWVPANRDEVGRLPPFFRVDLRVAKHWAFDDYRFELSLDVLNASGSQEVLGVGYGEKQRYSPEDPVVLERSYTGIPIIAPMLGAKASF